MPSINMIAPRRAEKRRLERDMRRLMAVILAEIVCAVALGGWVCTKLITTRARIGELDVQLARLRPIVRQIEEYDNATRKLAPKLELLNKAKERTMRWYNSLDRLTQSLPQSTYLTRIETRLSEKKDDAGATVNLTGISISQARIGETILRLAAIPDFERVDLYYSQPNSIDGRPAIEFSVGAVMKGDDKPKGAKSNGRTQS
ncbi:MAG: PilN domain-containing protein [Armatimonadetes bacterium]|nr:PilN domain-containing protein [Armatimonadota bacterium]